MRYIAIVIWFNGLDEKVAQIVENDEGKIKYFSSVDDILDNINKWFPGDVIALNLDTLETEQVL